MLLEIKNLEVFYNGHRVLHDINMLAQEGECIAVIGPNGAGKSTLLKAIAGILKPRYGEIRFNGKLITGLEPKQLINASIVFVPQGKRVFPNLTVLENVEVMLRGLKKEERNEAVEYVSSLFPILQTRRSALAGRLSGGEQQIVALARAMALKPKLLLLDEPSHGLSSSWAEMVFERVVELLRHNVTVVIVEQNVRKALSIANRGYVLKLGNVIREGKPVELIENVRIDWGFTGIKETDSRE